MIAIFKSIQINFKPIPQSVKQAMCELSRSIKFRQQKDKSKLLEKSDPLTADRRDILMQTVRLLLLLNG